MSRRMMWTTVITSGVVAALIAMVFVSGRKSATPPEEQKGTELVEMVPAEGETGESVAEKALAAEETGVDPSNQYEFLLVDHNDYVAVYQLPEREIYEYTDVIMEVLPEDVQKEVQHGKYIKNEEELYNFLENYTS